MAKEVSSEDYTTVDFKTIWREKIRILGGAPGVGKAREMGQGFKQLDRLAFRLDCGVLAKQSKVQFAFQTGRFGLLTSLIEPGTQILHERKHSYVLHDMMGALADQSRHREKNTQMISGMSIFQT